MLTLPTSVRVFVARGATDLRRSFDRPSPQVQEVLHEGTCKHLQINPFTYLGCHRARLDAAGAAVPGADAAPVEALRQNSVANAAA